jgi:RHS repeat-associated protein
MAGGNSASLFDMDGRMANERPPACLADDSLGQPYRNDEDPTGLLNEGFRYRDLETGTFITRDPLGFVDGPNMYAYVVQNPWTKFDPLGLKINRPKRQEAKDDDDERTRTQKEDHNKLVDSVNSKIDEMKSTPSGSAMYQYLDGLSESFDVVAGSGRDEINNLIGRSSYNSHTNTVNITADADFSTVAHELQHAVQDANSQVGRISANEDNYASVLQQIEQTRAKNSAAVLPVYDSSDDYSNPRNWKEQQAVRVENIVAAEHKILNAPNPNEPGGVAYAPSLDSSNAMGYESVHKWGKGKYYTRETGEL